MMIMKLKQKLKLKYFELLCFGKWVRIINTWPGRECFLQKIEGKKKILAFLHLFIDKTTNPNSGNNPRENSGLFQKCAPCSCTAVLVLISPVFDFWFLQGFFKVGVFEGVSKKL